MERERGLGEGGLFDLGLVACDDMVSDSVEHVQKKAGKLEKQLRGSDGF